MTTKTETRTITIELAIDAAVEDVWKALTDGVELARWFPSKASVTPGVGGSIHMEWTDFVSGDEQILAWEPPRHLRTSWVEPPKEEGASEGGAQAASQPARQLAVDYFIESKGGKTVLRLVHSGFSANPEWSQEYDSTSRGWKHELRSLRHYLERHRGKNRVHAWVRHRADGPAEQAFGRVMSADGLVKEGSLAGLREGDPYSIRTAAGDRFEGKVLVNDRLDFAGTVSNMGDSLLRVMVENCTGTQEAHLWLAAWTLPEAEVKKVGERFRETLGRLFPARG